MAFNTTSFIAGVGSVVVVLSTGFAGGYFIANPTRVDPPNRLQRLAAEDRGTAPAPAAAKPEVVAAATPVAAPPAPVVTPAPSPSAAPVQQAVAQPAATPAPASLPADVKPPEKSSEPAQTVAVKETAPPVADKPDTDKIVAQKAADKERAAEAKYTERKRSDARKVAEQQRKQRELEVATVAVRRIIHDRDGQDVIIRERDRNAPEIVENDPPQASAPAMPRFNLFGD